ncbi:hypothetical protein M0R45_030651 [Rubus argutus]|uniref:Uncharacterized protein n=1 Tax=Rubus argutus TaxID=59490 RepID=A0AAW1WBY6_RUBAR
MCDAGVGLRRWWSCSGREEVATPSIGHGSGGSFGFNHGWAFRINGDDAASAWQIRDHKGEERWGSRLLLGFQFWITVPGFDEVAALRFCAVDKVTREKKMGVKSLAGFLILVCRLLL